MTIITPDEPFGPKRPSTRAEALAVRLEKGAEALAAFTRVLTAAQWHTRVSGDGRKVGVVVHHVASVYPLEIQFAELVARGQPIMGVTMETVHQMNAGHARENERVTREETLELLLRNSAAAAEAIRTFSDEELDQAVPTLLYADAPVTSQFLLEDHAVRHSYHHLARIKNALEL